MSNIEKIRTVFQKVFEVSTIDESTTKADIDSWDSINHLSLMLELEEEFNISISPENMEKLNSVAEILKLIEE